VTQRRPTVDEPCDGLTVRDRLNQVALERDLRPSTRIAYGRCLVQLGIADELVGDVTPELVTERLWRLQNPNTRRGAAIAARSVLGFKLKIGKSVPRRYVLPSEQDIRLAAMTSPHETRILLLAFCALRVSEAAAVTRADLSGDRLRVDKQNQTLRETGQPTITRITATKTAAADVPVPLWLIPQIEALTEPVKADNLRESLRRAGARVGVPMNPHMLRHWSATTLLERGASLVTVSRVLRHSTIQQTAAVYIQVDDAAAVHAAFG
jgi:integrase